MCSNLLFGTDIFLEALQNYMRGYQCANIKLVTFSLALLLTLCTTESQAVFWRTDWPTGDPSWRTQQGGYMKNAARVSNSQTGSAGSGTLVQGRWLLTAKHVVDKNGGGLANPGKIRVRLEKYGGWYNVSEVHAPSGGADIALLKLSRAPNNVTQIPLNDRFDEKGKLVEIGGYGRYGPAGNQKGTGKFRRAQNIVSGISGGDFTINFTNPNNPNAVPREGIGAPGDSGGTVLLNDGEGQWYLGGVHRAGSNTNPDNNYGKKGWEKRVSKHKNWIEGFFDPLWRSEIEANPADLNIDGIVDVDDIQAMLDADGTKIPFTLKKFDLVDDDRIVAVHGSPISDLDAYITQGIGTQFGDTNLDKQINISDYNNLVAGFTGQGRRGGDWATGDTDFDNDVDGDDYFTIVDNFGFRNTGGTSRNDIPPVEELIVSNPTLLYEPLSGEVSLFGAGLDLDAFQIETFNEEDFFAEELNFAFDNGLRDVIEDGVFQLDLDGTSENESELGLQLGAILPVGLDLIGLQAIIETARYTAGPTISGNFELAIQAVPEPTTVVLLGFAVTAGVLGCRKRS